MPFSPRTLLAVAASFCLALVLTFLVRAFARRFGFVAAPKTDRWHKKPTAMLGGVAIWLSVVIASLPFTLQTVYGKYILLACAFLFLVGLIDDLIHIKPYQKLIGQILGSAYVVYYGLSLPWTGSVLLNMALAIFWLIGITNAINLLEQARALLGTSVQAQDQDEMNALFEIGRAFSRYDSKRSFEIVDPLIDQVNEICAAARTLEGFGAEYFEDDELNLLNGSNVAQAVTRMSNTLGTLAVSNFDRAKAAADRLRLAEVRLRAYLDIAQQSIMGAAK